MPVKSRIGTAEGERLVALNTALQVVSSWLPVMQLAKPLLCNQLTKTASGMVTYCALLLLTAATIATTTKAIF